MRPPIENDAPRRRVRRLLGIMIIGFAAIALTVGVVREIRAGNSERVAAEKPAGVVVRYLHGDKRCSTCKEIEARSAAVVRSAFASEFESGKLSFVATNYDRAENRHYLSDYELAFGSVVIEAPGGAFLKVDEVWDLVMEDSDALERCLEQHLRTFLEPGP